VAHAVEAGSVLRRRTDREQVAGRVRGVAQGNLDDPVREAAAADVVTLGKGVGNDTVRDRQCLMAQFVGNGMADAGKPRVRRDAPVQF
jgi:hypothetical protein